MLTSLILSQHCKMYQNTPLSLLNISRNFGNRVYRRSLSSTNKSTLHDLPEAKPKGKNFTKCNKSKGNGTNSRLENTASTDKKLEKVIWTRKAATPELKLFQKDAQKLLNKKVNSAPIVPPKPEVTTISNNSIYKKRTKDDDSGEILLNSKVVLSENKVYRKITEESKSVSSNSNISSVSSVRGIGKNSAYVRVAFAKVDASTLHDGIMRAWNGVDDNNSNSTEASNAAAVPKRDVDALLNYFETAMRHKIGLSLEECHAVLWACQQCITDANTGDVDGTDTNVMGTPSYRGMLAFDVYLYIKENVDVIPTTFNTDKPLGSEFAMTESDCILTRDMFHLLMQICSHFGHGNMANLLCYDYKMLNVNSNYHQANSLGNTVSGTGTGTGTRATSHGDYDNIPVDIPLVDNFFLGHYLIATSKYLRYNSVYQHSFSTANSPAAFSYTNNSGRHMNNNSNSVVNNRFKSYTSDDEDAYRRFTLMVQSGFDNAYRWNRKKYSNFTVTKGGSSSSGNNNSNNKQVGAASHTSGDDNDVTGGNDSSKSPMNSINNYSHSMEWNSRIMEKEVYYMYCDYINNILTANEDHAVRGEEGEGVVVGDDGLYPMKEHNNNTSTSTSTTPNTSTSTTPNTSEEYVAKDVGMQQVYDLVIRAYSYLGKQDVIIRALSDMLEVGGFTPSLSFCQDLLENALADGDEKTLQIIANWYVNNYSVTDLPHGVILKMLHIGCGRGCSQLTLHCIQLLRNCNYPVTASNYAAVVSACIECQDIPGIVEVLIDAQSNNISLETSEGVDFYRLQDNLSRNLSYSMRQVDDLYYALVNLAQQNVTVPRICVNAIIAACGAMSQLNRSFSLIQEYTTVFGLEPTVDTYNALLSAVAQSPTDCHLKTMLTILEEMEASSSTIAPNSHSYALLFDVMVDNLQYDCVYDILTHMMDADSGVIRPTEKSLRRLLVGLVSYQHHQQLEGQQEQQQQLSASVDDAVLTDTTDAAPTPTDNTSKAVDLIISLLQSDYLHIMDSVTAAASDEADNKHSHYRASSSPLVVNGKVVEHLPAFLMRRLQAILSVSPRQQSSAGAGSSSSSSSSSSDM